MIYNIHGQQVKTLVDEMLDAGRHIVNWDGSDRAGILFPPACISTASRQAILSPAKKCC
jgi:flagellar hook assembly protein FlgD